MSTPEKDELDAHQDKAQMLAEEEMGIVAEVWAFMKVRKRYWLAPVILAFIVLGMLFWFAGTNAAVAPFLYAL